MSDSKQVDETANARVLGLAGLASGLVGGALAYAMERKAQREEAAKETPSANMAALIDSVRVSANDSLSRVKDQAPQSRKEWAAAAQRLREQAAASAKESQKRSKRRLSEVDVERLSKRARKAVPTSGASDLAGQVRQRVGTAAGMGRHRSRQRIESIDIEGLTRKGKDSVSGLSSGVAAGAATLAAVAGQRSQRVVESVRQQSPQAKGLVEGALTEAKGLGERIVEQTRERVPELRDTVEQSVVPRLRDLQANAAPLLGTAASTVASTIDTGKVKASEAKLRAERELVPVLKDKAGTASKRAVARARTAETVLGEVSSQASQTFSGASGTLEERSRSVAQATAQGSRDTGAIAAWAAVGGGLIYYAFLDAEQREKLKAAGGRVLHEAREIYRDVQGYDDDFTEA